MKWNVLALKDEALKAYNRPILDSNEKDVIKQAFGRSMLADVRANPDFASKYVGNHLDLIAVFDDETGEMRAVPVECLVVCNDVLGIKEENDGNKNLSEN